MTGMPETHGEGSALGAFAKRRAVVTGAGQGIGAAIAKGLAARGAHVTLSGRRQTTLDAVCASITAEGGSAECCAGDVTDPEHLDQLMAHAGSDSGVIDILINNAGIPGPTAPLASVTLEEWNETIAVNLTGVFLACKAALPYLERAEHGKVDADTRPRIRPERHQHQCDLALARFGRASEQRHRRPRKRAGNYT
jgi:NAD(P)-dependent dehydrogenase (short-subunit alcohol dehydrogenase family)